MSIRSARMLPTIFAFDLGGDGGVVMIGGVSRFWVMNAPASPAGGLPACGGGEEKSSGGIGGGTTIESLAVGGGETGSCPTGAFGWLAGSSGISFLNYKSQIPNFKQFRTFWTLVFWILTLFVI